MNSSEWSVSLAAGYARDLESLKERHYRKNARAAQELDALLGSLIAAIHFNPLAAHYAEPPSRLVTKPYPRGYAVDGCIFRNARFKMPALRGAARSGRLYFDVHYELRVVRVLGVYTHVEHPQDLDDPRLIDRLKQEPLFRR